MSYDVLIHALRSGQAMARMQSQGYTYDDIAEMQKEAFWGKLKGVGQAILSAGKAAWNSGAAPKAVGGLHPMAALGARQKIVSGAAKARTSGTAQKAVGRVGRTPSIRVQQGASAQGVLPGIRAQRAAQQTYGGRKALGKVGLPTGEAGFKVPGKWKVLGVGAIGALGYGAYKGIPAAVEAMQRASDQPWRYGSGGPVSGYRQNGSGVGRVAPMSSWG